MMVDPAVEAVVTAIHAAPQRLVLEFAGAGSLALWWLHSVAGSSRTVLEATDRYAAAALSDLLGGPPAQFVAVETAAAMAAAAYRRAQLLAGDAGPLLGVGCTATIATGRAKRGEHRCAIAVRAAAGTATCALTLAKGRRDRYGEEALVSRLLLRAIAAACGLTFDLPLDLAPGEILTEMNHVSDSF